MESDTQLLSQLWLLGPESNGHSHSRMTSTRGYRAVRARIGEWLGQDSFLVTASRCPIRESLPHPQGTQLIRPPRPDCLPGWYLGIQTQPVMGVAPDERDAATSLDPCEPTKLIDVADPFFATQERQFRGKGVS